MSAMVVWIEVMEMATHIHARLAFHAYIGGNCVGFRNHKATSW